MKAKKSNLIVFLVIAAVLGENYLAYSCLFDGRRGYMELLLCGFFAHIVVAIVVALIAGLVLNAIIPEDESNATPCKNETNGNKDQHLQEVKNEDNAMSLPTESKAQSTNYVLQTNIPSDGTTNGKACTNKTEAECTSHITQSKLNEKDVKHYKPTVKPSITPQKVAPQIVVGGPMDMIAPLSPMPSMILQDQRSWMASDIRKGLMFDFALREAVGKVLRCKGVSEDLFYRKIAVASFQLNVSTDEIIDKLRIVQDNAIAMDEIVTALLLSS